MAITVQMRTEVSQLYVALFGRAPDGEGLGFWVNLRDQGRTLSQLADMMYATTPARTYFPSFLTNGEIIASFYSNVLGRAADSEGLAFWTGKLNAAGATPGSVIAEMITIVANYTGSDAAGKDSQSLFNNRVQVAQYYGEKNGNVTGATAALQGVTKDAATVTTAKSSIDGGTIGGVNQGQTFVLTTGLDNLTGTSGNDTFIGSAAPATVSAADQVNGGAGTDTLKIFGTTTLPAFSGIEILYFDNPGAGVTTTAFSEVTQLQINNDPTGYTHTISAAQNVSLSNITGNSTQITLPATDSSLDLTVNAVATAAGGARAVDINGAAVATVNIIASTAASNITLANSASATAIKTLNISGDAKVTLDAATNALTGITTVNAASNTGGVFYTASNANVKFTGGTGVDQVTFAAGQFNGSDVVDGGAGIDVIKVNDTAFTDGTSNQVKGLNAAKNVEVLAFNAAGVTLDAALITSGINTFRADTGGGTYALSNLNNSSVVEVNAVTIGANDFTIANKLGDLTANLKMTATSAAAASVAQLVLTGVGTLNISSGFTGQGSQSTGNTVTVKTNADNTVFNLSGSQALTFSGVQATTTGSTIDGSGMTGKLTATGSAKADILKGGSAGDTLNGGAGNDTLTGGGGADTFLLAGGDAVVAGTGNVNTITDFTSGSDKIGLKRGNDAFVNGLNLDANTTFTLNTAQTIATAADLAAVYAGITAITASTAGTVQAALVTVSAGAAAGTYVYINDNTAAVTAAEDVLVKLTGSTTFVVGDFSTVA